MSRRKVVLTSALAAVVAAVFIGQAFSQESRPNRGNFDPAQFRQQMADRIKELLGATDDEWKVLEPKIEKVTTLARQTRGGMGMMGMMRRRGGGGDGAAPTAPPQDQTQSDVEKAIASLQKILENKDAKPEEIKPALAALRDARTKAKTELQAAQKELQEVLSVRQEAVMVEMGLLE